MDYDLALTILAAIGVFFYIMRLCYLAGWEDCDSVRRQQVIPLLKECELKQDGSLNQRNDTWAKIKVVK